MVAVYYEVLGAESIAVLAGRLDDMLALGESVLLLLSYAWKIG